MTQTLITVTGHYVTATGGNATGRVTFLPMVWRAPDQMLGTMLGNAPVGVVLASGAFSLALIPTDDPDRLPVGGFLYRVSEFIDGAPDRSYLIEVPIGSVGGTLDLSAVTPVAPQRWNWEWSR